MQISRLLKSGVLLGGLVLSTIASLGYADGWYGGTQSSNVGSISNTRHNLTMSYLSSDLTLTMNLARNNYFEVCVYCHTPHGANSQVGAPLWNRTVSRRTYQLFTDRVTTDNLTPEPTLAGQVYTQPGPNSLTCLSCHDGATAIDSIINMPTQLTTAGQRAGWNPDAEILENISTTPGSDWDQNLDAWSNNLLDSPGTTDHAGLNSNTNYECFSCHQPGGPGPDFGILAIGADYNDVTPESSVGVNDLRDDHPIGVRFPMGDAAKAFDYNEPDVKQNRIAFWDRNDNGHADPNEIRVYDTGDGYEVECGSCHDPHGVPVEGQSGSALANLTPSFLRVGAVAGGDGYSAITPAGSPAIANPGSQVCLTCHVK